MWHSVLYHALFFAKVACQLTTEHVPEFYYETHLSDKHYLNSFPFRISSKIPRSLFSLTPNVIGRYRNFNCSMVSFRSRRI
ncbi:hypothetical protein T12_13036 [Trichinella patagoniensis]|uniref:Secreted protein n=1 Tax=Trichinella patagoniensis TaxID=990121 RepID=A0A0V0YRL2_9BILA|nr:hypothetical protein T12_13036 [Trichinella patagoniensis]